MPPDTASWGGLLNDAQRYYDVAWWLMLFPGLFLVVTTLAFNLLGDGLPTRSTSAGTGRGRAAS